MSVARDTLKTLFGRPTPKVNKINSWLICGALHDLVYQYAVSPSSRNPVLRRFLHHPTSSRRAPIQIQSQRKVVSPLWWSLNTLTRCIYSKVRTMLLGEWTPDHWGDGWGWSWDFWGQFLSCRPSAPKINTMTEWSAGFCHGSGYRKGKNK